MKINRITFVQTTLAAAGSAWVVWKCLQQPLTAIRAVGLTVGVASFGLWATARIELGRSFSVKPQARELVINGLYSKIRNPVYIFGGACVAGFMLAIGKPVWLLFLAPLLPTQWLRARREARVLEEKFGDAYRDYRHKTWL